MTKLKLPYPNPSYIYEGTDDSKYENADGKITNRAPKQIEANAEYIAGYAERSLNVIAIWDADQSYALDELTSFAGDIYKCIKANTGSPPTDKTSWVSTSLLDIQDNDGLITIMKPDGTAAQMSFTTKDTPSQDIVIDSIDGLQLTDLPIKLYRNN